MSNSDANNIESTTSAATGDAKVAKRNKRKKRQHYSESDLSLRFSSCGRCGVFITSYRLNHNQEFLQAVDEIEADWLALPWHSDMRELVNKSYGCRIDIESYYLEGICKECLRPFSYAQPEPDQTAWFLVKI